MQIRMLETAVGCDDGINARHYLKGEVYLISHGLAKNFLHLKVAEPVVNAADPVDKVVDKEKAKQSHDNKALTDYQNKATKPKSNKEKDHDRR